MFWIVATVLALCILVPGLIVGVRGMIRGDIAPPPRGNDDARHRW